MTKEPLIMQAAGSIASPEADHQAETAGSAGSVGRRQFLRAGAAAMGMGLVASARSLGQALPRPYPPPQTPVQTPTPGFVPPYERVRGYGMEVPAGITPDMMLGTTRQLINTTVDSRMAGRVTEARPIHRQLENFHSFYASDYNFQASIPVTRTRYGYYLQMDNYLICDSMDPCRVYKDFNYFEMRRVLHPTEVRHYGMVVHPCSYRMRPSPAHTIAFQRVARDCYSLRQLDDYTVLYYRRFSNASESYYGYFVARGPNPMYSPYRDLFIDNRPI